MVASEEYFDFKFVIDNEDKNVMPSFECLNSNGYSMHYVHGYAVKCRIGRSGQSDKSPHVRTPDPDVMIPSCSDVKALQDDSVILVSRYVVNILYNHFALHINSILLQVPLYIPSKYSKEMAMKSDVVSSCGNRSMYIWQRVLHCICKIKHEVHGQDANKSQGEAECFIGIKTAAKYFILCTPRARPCFNCFKELTHEHLIKAYPFQIFHIH